jgi:PTH1 family peptidyl-tRNA hydrolase
MKCFLSVGLGNPEGKYFNSWHNLGFLAAEKFAANHNAEFKKKGNQLIAEMKIADNKVFVLKPLTYMNLSGQAVLAVVRKYKIPVENIIVFTDDIYINIGSIRVTVGGGSGGHNGIKSVNELLKVTSYTKIRIGAKPKNEIKGNTADYVLSAINCEVRPHVDESINIACKAALEIISGGGTETVKGKYNHKNTGEE